MRNVTILHFVPNVKIDLSINRHLPEPPSVVQKPLGTYLDRIIWTNPSCLQSEPIATMRSLSKLSHSLKFRQLYWSCQVWHGTLCQGWKAQSLMSSLSVYHIVTPLQVSPRCFQELGMGLCYLKNKLKPTILSQSSLCFYPTWDRVWEGKKEREK